MLGKGAEMSQSSHRRTQSRARTLGERDASFIENWGCRRSDIAFSLSGKGEAYIVPKRGRG